MFSFFKNIFAERQQLQGTKVHANDMALHLTGQALLSWSSLSTGSQTIDKYTSKQANKGNPS